MSVHPSAHLEQARAADGSLAIETHDLSKRYGKIVALDGLVMSAPRGEVFGFLGPNGAGKTTAVKLLLGLVRPTSGHGAVLGAPLGDRTTRRAVGYLPELFPLPGVADRTGGARPALRTGGHSPGAPGPRGRRRAGHRGAGAPRG